MGIIDLKFAKKYIDSKVSSFIDPSAIDVARAGLVRSQRHSGVIDYKPIVTGSTTNLNSITIPETTYSVNGYEITMPLTVITLPIAPANVGEKWEDFVLFESWFPSTGNGYAISGRYRTVSNVNFTTYPDGVNDTVNVKAWGGNVANTALTYAMGSVDKGVYVSGSGSAGDKATLLTYDGYSYAIPLFRVKRRNSSGFSPANPNGGRNYFSLTPTAQSPNPVNRNSVTTITVSSGASTLQIGDIVTLANYTYLTLKVESIVSDTQFTATYLGIDSTCVVLGNQIIKSSLLNMHPQSLYSNVIDQRDITDLRHETKAQYNYDYILKKADDQFKRGELSPKKMLTEHHGIPKTEIDGNTVFYASLDGTLVPEFPLGSSAMNLGTGSFKPMPTGSGYKFNGDSALLLDVSGISVNDGSIGFEVNTVDLKNETASFPIAVSIRDSSDTQVFSVIYGKSVNVLYLEEKYTDSTTVSTPSNYTLSNMPYLNICASWDSINLYLRVNGNLIGTVARKSNTLWKIPAKVRFGSSNLKSTLSNISISNIDRGSLFPNLPPDFISGDAIIMPAYTDQRRILSEAQMSQTVNSIVKSTNLLNSHGINRVVIGTPNTWSASDTITVTGMAGELISGVFDEGTALAKVTYISGEGTTSLSYKAESVSGISVGDIVVPVYGDTWAPSSAVFTITSVDTATKIINVTSSVTIIVGYGIRIAYLVETTTASSVPLAYHMVAGVKTAVVGTWATLGTNVATFTLGTNAGLVAQDIQIDYSLIMPAGQPAFSVPTTTTLMGEAGFRLPYANQTIVSDYASKISGRTWENPNIAKTLSGIVANNPAPSAFLTELDDVEYPKIYTQNGVVTTFSTSINGEQACVLLGFDAIKWAERKLGCKIPAVGVTSKVAWIKNNLSALTGNVWCSGSSTAGNIAALKTWNVTNTAYSTGSYSNSNASIAKVSFALGSGYASYITAEGYVFFVVYSGTSNGDIPSTINVDYASLDIKFADKIVNSFGLATGQTVDIRDDFAGKIVGSIVECPNTISISVNTSLITPSDTVGVVEVSNWGTTYDQLTSLNNTLCTVANNVNLAIAQMRFKFNLIRIVEDKMGTIPAIDKVQWLKDNLTSITCNWWGYGSSPTGNKATLAGWYQGAWSSTSSTYHTNSSVTKVLRKFDEVASGSINLIGTTNDGFVHFLSYAEPSDGVTASTIYTDYCNIELTLKKPTGYDVLSPSNPRRDSGLSNILLVRKETKEVQSLFPYSNEFMLTTYSDYLEAPTPISANTDVTILAEADDFTLTDIGSAVGNKIGTHQWGNIASKTLNDNDNMSGEFGYSVVKFAPDSKGINIGSKVTVNATGFANNYWKQFALNTVSKPMVGIARYLVLVNGELKLFVFSKYSATGGFTTDGTGIGILINLQGKPLSKESEGIVRSGVNTPTAWKSGELIPTGYVDKATGKLITTNNSI